MIVSIIIPCFNELKTIRIIIDQITEHIKYKHEIIIIDDNSTDGTRQLLKQTISKKIPKIFYNEKNFGKGYCIKKGIKEASGDIILIQDADLEYSPKDYTNLIEPIINNYADVVFGSRFRGGKENRVLRFWHYIANKILTTFSNIFTNYNLTDMECGYKVFRSNIIKKIQLEENRFGFEPEITAKISKLNIRLYEVSVSYYGRTYAEGKKITLKDAFRALYCIIKYRLF